MCRSVMVRATNLLVLPARSLLGILDGWQAPALGCATRGLYGNSARLRFAVFGGFGVDWTRSPMSVDLRRGVRDIA